MKKQIVWMAACVAVAACSSSNETTSSPDGGDVQATNDAGNDTAHPDAAVSEVDSGTIEDSGTTEPDASADCTGAREQLLQPVDEVSTGEVSVLSDTAGVKTIFVDASAGGATAASTHARVYVNLETVSRVDVTDKAAPTSTAWDLAIKRPILFTNSGDGGSGQGGSVHVDKDFDAVTTADASSVTFKPEGFFEADCTAKLDQTGAVKTSFDQWYDYDPATNHLSPHPGTWLVKGGTGKLYKVQILSYYATADGGVGQAGGRYTLKVGAL